MLQALNPALGYYLSAHAEVSPVTRGILINWLIEVSAVNFLFPFQLDISLLKVLLLHVETYISVLLICLQVHFKFDLMHETLYLTMDLLDRYLSQVPIHKNEMQLIGLTALLLASKYEDYWHPRVRDNYPES